MLEIKLIELDRVICYVKGLKIKVQKLERNKFLKKLKKKKEKLLCKSQSNLISQT